MKNLIFLLACAVFCTVSAFPQNYIVKPKGAQIQSLRNDEKSELIIPGCERDGLKIDDINNLYGANWSFYFVGTVEKLSDITATPPCSASKIVLRKSCGYVACHKSSSGNKYVRLYVTEMVTNKSNEIIGATILYEWDYQMETVEGGVIINGITWSTKNVEATSPEDYGGYYTWEEAQKVCPKGWRLPTMTELESLSKLFINPHTDRWNSMVKIQGVSGYKFGTNERNIFLPAAGYCTVKGRYSGDYLIGKYWSSDRSDWYAKQYGVIMEFSQGSDPALATFPLSESCRFSVRCVKE